MKLHLYITVAALLLLSGCADNKFNTDYDAPRPGEVALYEYLNQYAHLKDIATQSPLATPGLKLGISLAAGEFTANDLVHSVVCANFDEITPQAMMNHQATVSNSGVMDFSSPALFVQKAREAGQTLFGDALCSHYNQNGKYLRSLLEPTIIPAEPIDPDEPGEDAGYCLIMQNDEVGGANWARQIMRELPEALETGVVYRFSCVARATKNYSCQLFVQDGGDQQYLPSIGITTKWSALSFDFAASAPNKRILFNIGDFNGTIYIDDIKLMVVDTRRTLLDCNFEDGTKQNWFDWSFSDTYERVSELGQGYNPGVEQPDDIIIEKTDEEKRQLLTDALNNWISGLMNACDDYLTAWNVLNQPLTSTGELRTSANAPAGEDADTHFYWADYLGDDYVRTVVSQARQSYAAGQSAGLQLFVQETGLEAAGLAKAQKLLNHIAAWEADGSTRIDGIGLSLQLNLYADMEQQRQNQENLAELFDLMASSGKIIRIADLEINAVNSKGKPVPVSNLTYEDQLAIADFFRYIVHQYLTTVPAAQQYGISLGTLTGTGLWNADFNRNPAYAGFVEGFSSNN